MSKLDEQGEPSEYVTDEGRYAKGRVLADVDAQDEQLRNFVTLVTRMMAVYKVRSVMLNLMTDDEHDAHTPPSLTGEDDDDAPTKPAPSAVEPTMRAGRRNDN